MIAILQWRAVGGALLGAFFGVLALAGVVMAQGGRAALDVPAPAIGGGPWINTVPLTSEALRGRVVFVEFWTYG